MSLRQSSQERPVRGFRPGRWVWPLLAVMVVLAVVARAVVAEAASVAGREIVYGGDAHFFPYEFLDDNGEPAGLNIDLMRAIARSHGFTVRFRLGPWARVREQLARGEVDVAAMYRSAQRAAEVEFAIPHELVYHEMYIRLESEPLRTLDDLAGRRILVETGTYSVDALQSLGFGANIVPVESEPAALQALAKGEGDVAIVTQTVGRPFEKRQEFAGKIAATGSPVLLSEYAFVVRLGRRDLVEVLNDGVVAVKSSGEYEALYDRWVRPGGAFARWARWLVWALVAATGAALWFVLWNRVLRRRVAERTADLRREFEERERIQTALAENERKLRQAQKMESVGRLAGGVAHDFNNILTVILNYANFLRLDLLESGQPTADVDEILAAAERAARLTRQLLAFSRETPVEVVPLDLVEVVREIGGMIRRLVGEQVRVETVLPEAPVVAEIDRSAIEQALLNLAANARDAMQHQGRLQVGIGRQELAAANALGLPPGEYASIAVIDSGCGMDENTMAHLAEPFFTTKEVGKGTGLGLASVFATVAKHGGKVAVRSEVGRGSCFEILLPLVDGPAAVRSGDVAVPAGDPVAGQGRTVLLVEDDDALRRAAQIALSREGFHVLEARDGENALECVAGGKAFDLVVTDVVMPRSNGPRLVAELRRRTPALLVLFVSGYVQQHAGLDLDAEGTAFLAKPYTSAQLVAAVRQLFSGGQPRRSVVRVVV